MVRFKNRYFTLHIQGHGFQAGKGNVLNEGGIYSQIRDIFVEKYGNLTFGREITSLQIKYFNPITNLVVLRCSREGHKLVEQCLKEIEEIRGKDARIRILNISGNVRCCKRTAIATDKKLFSEISQRLNFNNFDTNSFENHIKRIREIEL